VDFDLIIIGHAATFRFSFDGTTRKHGEEFAIILRRPRLRLKSQRGGKETARRRIFTPRLAQFFEKRHVDLIEHLLARPLQVENQFGDERAPRGRLEALVA
jgi:hypothetical protein